MLAAAAPGDVIVGSGLIAERPLVLPSGCRVLALRGPRSRELLTIGGAVAEPDGRYGDPGLLAAEVFGIAVPETLNRERIAVIPHFAEKRIVSEFLARNVSRAAPDLVPLDVQADPRALLRQLSTCGACVSSSLHGIIAAESLGIPAVRFSATDKVIGGGFKFDDYYLGTGRTPQPALCLSDALERARQDAVRFRPDAEPIRSALRDLASLIRETRG